MPKTDLARLIADCRIEDGKGFRLKDHAPRVPDPPLDKAAAEVALSAAVAKLDGLQQRLYAEDRQSVLAIFQAMDGAGKDSTIRAVFSGINPQGCQVAAFKAPGPAELEHDFLWRHMHALPARGNIAVHNRSWYEEALVVRVHPEILERRNIPAAAADGDFWKTRLRDIANFEQYLANQGVIVLKFFLNLSFDEQRDRFLSRIDEPEKTWKFDAGDIAERRRWPDYQEAYEAAIGATATKQAPWIVVPADRKWLARLIVAETLLAALEKADPQYPKADTDGLQAIRSALLTDGAAKGG
ncbi:PPK2 family polyphosphate kinase [Roseomonas haemaphysalidis]|uniref:Polyphosphate kinase 2 family protein n=1 Tax=Roseomonas haemaphysalidis TaxID=2768162 RepID=A0ABS3KS07_9PROT|nr:PPK2 family polyphosphate kinase [Roseomonas haemaphysalidis]MBO1079817.1 polyphosphate kinase 2 family protein [Roseomonas haemaphysalidis]